MLIPYLNIYGLNLNNPKSLTLDKPSFNSVRMAFDQNFQIDKQANCSFQIGPHFFQDGFLFLPTMNCLILGNPSFKKHKNTIGPQKNLLQLPDMTVQLNQNLFETVKKRSVKELPKILLILTKKSK